MAQQEEDTLNDEVKVETEEYNPYLTVSTKKSNTLHHEDWDADIQASKYCYTAEDLIRNFDWFEAGRKWVYIRKDDGYLPLLYRGKRCIFETAPSQCLFGLESYCNPDSTIKKYSINFNLRTDGRKDMEELVLLISKLDMFVQQHQVSDQDKFYPSIQNQRRNKTSTLRLKIPSYKKQLNIKIILEQTLTETVELAQPSIDEFNHYITPGTKVVCQLLINNIWRAAGKYGISYKLLKMRIIDDVEDLEFRD